MKQLSLSLLFLTATCADACSVCFQGGNARGAYLATTGALASLPFLMIGGFIIVVRRRMKREQTLEEHTTV